MSAPDPRKRWQLSGTANHVDRQLWAQVLACPDNRRGLAERGKLMQRLWKRGGVETIPHAGESLRDRSTESGSDLSAGPASSV
jgi:hypothetical protein